MELYSKDYSNYQQNGIAQTSNNSGDSQKTGDTSDNSVWTKNGLDYTNIVNNKNRNNLLGKFYDENPFGKLPTRINSSANNQNKYTDELVTSSKEYYNEIVKALNSAATDTSAEQAANSIIAQYTNKAKEIEQEFNINNSNASTTNAKDTNSTKETCVKNGNDFTNIINNKTRKALLGKYFDAMPSTKMPNKIKGSNERQGKYVDEVVTNSKSYYNDMVKALNNASSDYAADAAANEVLNQYTKKAEKILKEFGIDKKQNTTSQSGETNQISCVA